MSIDLAAILIGVLAIFVSVLAGMYAASAISSEYVAKITSRLISLERKVDTLLENQSKTSTINENGMLTAHDSGKLLDEPVSEKWLSERPKD
jgi:hypothetical protein